MRDEERQGERERLKVRDGERKREKEIKDER